ncbi:MAG: ribosomal large subunit pseudouridine synthase D [Microgenomates group bacterium GW2011_GWC1_37_8]|nr:MAG: ribosomal large subunit pseudouridine synthase D [Microgenomates group bacterium GW2011_GWC1_37_8]
MVPKVIFEDEYLIILDKPPGWIVNEAETTGDIPVVQKWLKKVFDYSIVKSKDYRSGVVHRLDKETSGILVLLHGRVTPVVGEIKTLVGRLPWRRDRFGVLPGGREAETRYRVISNFSFRGRSASGGQFPRLRRGFGGQAIFNEKFSFVEFYPKTGRTHQIRIHSKYLGHPIVADDFYAGRKTARSDKKWCSRLFLHSAGISFIHPRKNKMVTFESKLPEDLQLALKSLEKVS